MGRGINSACRSHVYPTWKKSSIVFTLCLPGVNDRNYFIIIKLVDRFSERKSELIRGSLKNNPSFFRGSLKYNTSFLEVLLKI